MIIEGLLTSTAEDGQPRIAPIGPVVDADLKHWVLRPFTSSGTFARLRKNPVCVFHVVDDVLPLVRAVLRIEQTLTFTQVASGGWVYGDACHWFQLRVVEWDLENARTEAKAVVEAEGVLRPFWGWNRAKHAVLEATILTTRLHLLEPEFVAAEFQRLESAVQKTAGERETSAWKLLLERLRAEGIPVASSVA